MTFQHSSSLFSLFVQSNLSVLSLIFFGLLKFFNHHVMSFLFLYYRKGFPIFFFYIYTVNTPHNSSEDDEAKCIGERTPMTPDDVYFKKTV